VNKGIAESNVVGGSVIEGEDVFNVNGQTRSKCKRQEMLRCSTQLTSFIVYSSVKFINDQVHSVSGSGVGVHMIIPGTGYEGSSGGPFFRDINNQGTAQQEFYFYMNSNHAQTETYRQGLHGPYALWFTTGSTPSVDYGVASIWDVVNPTGYVKASGRGSVIGKAIDVPSAYAGSTVIGWSNSVAQYWAKADASTGNFASPAMKPGTYTMTRKTHITMRINSLPKVFQQFTRANLPLVPKAWRSPQEAVLRPTSMIPMLLM
jgi:rhamnogalacturonan endolyase